MNGKDIFLGLRYIDEDLIEEAEFGKFPARKVKTFRRPLLIAAVIALTLLLVGCAVVYVLSAKGLTMGQEQWEYDSFDPTTLEYLGKETVTEQVLTLAGIQGTPVYQAAQEWFDFQQQYDPDRAILSEVWGNTPEFPEEYYGFNLYTQEMKEALDAIVAKHGLKLPGKQMKFRTTDRLLDALGMEKILVSGNGAEIAIDGATWYEQGNLDLSFQITLPEEEGLEQETTWGNLMYRRKDCFIGDEAQLDASLDWKEWKYTTASGHEVLILRSPESWKAWLFCDRGDSTISLRVEAIHEVYSELTDGTDIVKQTPLSDRHLELLADSIDFTLQPKLVEGWENLPDGAVGSGVDVDGYSVRLKSAVTDGYYAILTLGITGPEGKPLKEDPTQPGGLSPMNIFDGFFEPVTDLGTNLSASFNAGAKEDGDGLENTYDYVLYADLELEDGSMPFGEDVVWNIYFQGLATEHWNAEKAIWEQTPLTDAIWSFDVTFAGNDFREIELLTQPITAKACVGWDMYGNDVFEELEITSIKLRSVSLDLACEKMGPDFLCFTGQFSSLVMKDGTRMEVTSERLDAPVDLDEVSHLILADGTVIPVPGVEAAPPAETAPDPVPEGIELLSGPMDYYSLGGYAVGPDGAEEPLYEIFRLTSVTLSEDLLVIHGTWAFDAKITQIPVVMRDGTEVLFTGCEGAPYPTPQSRLAPETPIDLTQAAYVLLPDGTQLDIPQ